MRFADLIEKHNDELAALETWDNGKPYEQAAKIEVPMVARLIRYYAGMYIQGTYFIFCFIDSECNSLLSVCFCEVSNISSI